MYKIPPLAVIYTVEIKISDTARVSTVNTARNDLFMRRAPLISPTDEQPVLKIEVPEKCCECLVLAVTSILTNA